ncbi:hypothetical protein AVEN_71335-1 [Araneus ventricosus]|uniref:Uncharacterized protein n=1 Tax=Araneus ventricosus TaxID=182803 RepID=A0A4Y2BKJ5_ARAVE|nr:hypothetical protein AVEN_71335-1 [Araneus ventricosus]
MLDAVQYLFGYTAEMLQRLFLPLLSELLLRSPDTDVDDTSERQSFDFCNRNIFHLSFLLSSLRQRTCKQSFDTCFNKAQRTVDTCLGGAKVNV